MAASKICGGHGARLLLDHPLGDQGTNINQELAGRWPSPSFSPFTAFVALLRSLPSFNSRHASPPFRLNNPRVSTLPPEQPSRLHPSA
ncbi:hypothetical protein EJ110_NYTH24596 [Nymphaea thermarum]|nr:hypothetical protein EJ110_NYTH24596 [Nymphaea thermarum]